MAAQTEIYLSIDLEWLDQSGLSKPLNWSWPSSPRASDFSSPPMSESAVQDVVSTVATETQVIMGGPSRTPFEWRPWVRQIISFLGIILLLAFLWEASKFIGGTPWHLKISEGAWVDLDWQPPFYIPITNDLNMPHLWDILGAFPNPAQRNGPPLINVLVNAAFFTMFEALIGFIMGAGLGLLLGIVFVRSPLLERGLVPYVVASQTVPILAIAPMVVAWLQYGWWPVAIIAAYLTFFPVTINTLRGLRSPDPRALELMRSYAASERETLLKVRLPAAAPYIFTALKISATSSIVGAIIGELPSGISEGLGRALLDFSRFYITGPQKLWAALVVAAGVGILFFVVVVLAEKIVLRNVVREA